MGDLFSQIGSYYDVPAGTYSFKTARVIVTNRNRVIGWGDAVNLSGWQVTVNKATSISIPDEGGWDDTNKILTILWDEMPNALATAIAAEVNAADDSKPYDVEVAVRALAKGLGSETFGGNMIYSEFGKYDRQKFVIDPTAKAVKIKLSEVSSEFADHCTAASAWCLNFTTPLHNDNVTVYMTNVTKFGNADDDLVNETRAISGSKLAY
jgi:hypothetical protein